MYWVDLAWPWGLSLISFCTYLYAKELAENDGGDITIKAYIICVFYFLHGARMGMGSLYMLCSGTWSTKEDLKRYQFQKIRTEAFGGTWNRLIMVKEIYAQMVANSGLLFLPAVLVATDKSGVVHPLEMFGFGMWVFGWVIESYADTHKLAFDLQNSKLVQDEKKPFCDYGLWYYSRHPNYFGEWVAWSGLAISAIIPLSNLAINENAYGVPVEFVRGGLYFCLTMVCLSLYYCLSEWTGAIPAEHFSRMKRVGYNEYCETTSMLIPWFKKGKVA